jgi:hypothetical protein
MVQSSLLDGVVQPGVADGSVGLQRSMKMFEMAEQVNRRVMFGLPNLQQPRAEASKRQYPIKMNNKAPRRGRRRRKPAHNHSV